MRLLQTLLLSLSLLVVTVFATENSMANPSESRMYGQAAPFTIEQLPNNRLRSQLEKLPNESRERAMRWLNSFSFPGNDMANIHVDKRGGVFYQDPMLPEEISQAQLEQQPSLAGINNVDTFKLHSKANAANTVYLNFLGFTIEGTSWNNSYDIASYQAAAYNTDGVNGLSDIERAEIAEIWHRVAEDLAPFDIDVTTEAPLAFGPSVGHILITSNTDTAGQEMPYVTSGGVAYVGVWGRSNYEYYQPALVYFDNLANAPYYIAEASSHELGHNLSLSHDGSSTTSYYSGHGTDLTSWAPIMGNSYYSNVTQWSNGEYADANNTQDDIALITERLNLIADDHGNNALLASPLLVDSVGNIASSNPEFDPSNVRPDNKGIIETRNDIDVFYFDTGAGDISLTIDPAWTAFTRTSKRGSNLDIKARLINSSGVVIAEDDYSDDTEALLNLTVDADRYTLEITGVGNDTESSNYSDYASLSQYYITGTIVSVSSDTTAPNPDPLTWAIAPSAVSKSSIEMTATTAIDDSGYVEYQFICTAGGQGCIASAWQESTSYITTGLEANYSYEFQVKARDNSGNETALSSATAATTLFNLNPNSQDDIVTANENTTSSIEVLINDNDADGDNLTINSIGIASHGEGSINGNTINYTPSNNYYGADSFTYTVSDGFGGYSSSTVYVEVIGTNDAPIAVSDNAEVLLSGSVIIDVLANDIDQEGSILSIVSVTQGAKGSIIINSDGTVTYTAANKKRGGDVFSYTITDGEMNATTTVNLTIVKTLSSIDTGGNSGSGGKCNSKKGC